MKQRNVYSHYKDARQNLVHLWKLFQIAELHEVMRQRGASELIDLQSFTKMIRLTSNQWLILGLKAEKQLQKKNHTPGDNGHVIY